LHGSDAGTDAAAVFVAAATASVAAIAADAPDV
jgi:hypothetical protein